MTVASADGAVKIRQGSVWESPAIGMQVALPAVVSTGEDGSISLKQGGTVIAIAANSAIELYRDASAGETLQRVVQSRGSAFYDVAPREKSKLRVETPYLVAVIKGTEFNVNVASESSTVALFEGRLQIEAPDIGEVVDLLQGHIARRHRNDPHITVIGMDDGEPLVQGASGGRSDAGSPGDDPARDDRIAGGGRTAGDPDGTSDFGGAGSDLAGRAGDDLPGVSVRNDDSVVDLSIDTGGGVIGTKAGVELSGDIGIDGTVLGAEVDLGDAAGVDVGLAAGVDLGRGAVDLGVDIGADLGDVVGVESDLAASVDLDAGDVDLGADVSADLGDIADLGAGLDAGVDLGTGDVDLGADVSAGLGDVADLDAGVDAGVDLGAGDVDLGADVGTDLGDVADVDAGLDAGVDLGSGDVDLGADVSAGLGDVAGVDAGLDIGADTGSGEVDAAVDVAGVGVDLGLDTGGGLDGLLDAELDLDLLDDSDSDDDSADDADDGPILDLGRLFGR